MLRTFAFSCLIAVAGAALLAGCSPRHSDIVVARIGDSTITMAEYENLYVKSNGSRDMGMKATMEEREKFLELMTKFRLKLADAYRRGLDKSPEVLNEIDQYKGSLTAAYLTDREVTSPGTRRMYDRRKTEYRASHILFTLSAEASAADSLAAYTKAYEAIGRLKAGEDFAKLAEEYSQDPSAKQNKGDLYYFSAGQMVPPFEDTVFTMQPGQFTTMPVRTQFGLHIIKVTDKKPAPGEIQCSHIMIRFPSQDPSPEDTLEAYGKIKAIQDSLIMGLDFAELAKRNSGDPGSSSKGGDLGWFSRRRWIQSFDEVAFRMRPGEVSSIVRTIYGYHLIKCYGERPPKSFEESRKDMQQLYQQTRFQEDNKKFIDGLKKETQFHLHEDVLTRFISSLDSNMTSRDTNWTAPIPEDLRSATLISFGTRNISLDSVISLLKAHQDFNNMMLRSGPMRTIVDKVAEQLVFTVKGERIEREYPEFASIMREYREGILLYQIEQDQVWNKIEVGDSALHIYFDKHRDKYMFPDRVQFEQLRFTNDSLAHVAYDLIMAGKSFTHIVVDDSLRMSKRNNYHLDFKQGSARLSAEARKLLDAVAQDLGHEAALKLQCTAQPDTSARKSQNRKLAAQRLAAVSAYLKRSGIADDRITTHTAERGAGTSPEARKEAAEFNSRISVDITGRRPAVIGKAEVQILPITTDERTRLADSLGVGVTSQPFKHSLGSLIIRATRKDPARQKTFEEAGTEISSGFQENESKRLENEWLDGLRRAYPVVQYREALKDAFPPTP